MWFHTRLSTSYFIHLNMSSMQVRNINKLSRLFQPATANIVNAKKSEQSSRNYENLIKYGMIKQINNGMYALLPLGLRVLNKLTTLVDNEMEKIGAQKLILPALTPSHLWKKTERYYDNTSELFKIKDRAEREYILSPTCEETICTLISSLGILSSKMFPLRLYQISTKWRDEIKPRFGLLRSREFIMKDLYTFDINMDNAQETYAAVCEAYDNIFKNIGITCVKAVGNPGLIGGTMSHEYHYISDIGEDSIYTCSSCHYAINKTMCNDTHCPKCKTELRIENAAEVGHTFLLDTKYTKPLSVVHNSSNVTAPLVMGCFGLGLSRIFAVVSELLSTQKELRWPKHLAPYTVCIIPPKKGSKEEVTSECIGEIINTFDRLNIDAILDDRTNLTIGTRLMFARSIGFPYIVIVGKSMMKSPGLIEIHNINDSTQCEIPLENLPNYFNDESIKNHKGI